MAAIFPGKNQLIADKHFIADSHFLVGGTSASPGTTDDQILHT